MASAEAALVGVIMGSKSDWEYMAAAAEVMSELKIAHEVRVLSAHRTPDLTLEYAASAAGRGLRAIIAGAGGAAHLAGVVAAKTLLPVIGVPMPTTSLNGMDSLLSIVQMPKAGAGGDDGDRQAGGGECGPVCGGDNRAQRRAIGGSPGALADRAGQGVARAEIAVAQTNTVALERRAPLKVAIVAEAESN